MVIIIRTRDVPGSGQAGARRTSDPIDKERGNGSEADTCRVRKNVDRDRVLYAAAAQVQLRRMYQFHLYRPQKNQYLLSHGRDRQLFSGADRKEERPVNGRPGCMDPISGLGQPVADVSALTLPALLRYEPCPF